MFWVSIYHRHCYYYKIIIDVFKKYENFKVPMGKWLLSFTGPARCFQVLHRKQHLPTTALLSEFKVLQWDQRKKYLHI